jgi:xylose isomerase
MSHKYFPDVTQPIPFEGKDSRNPLAFKYYNKADRKCSRTF